MAFSDDGVKAKLSALNETQESIVGCSQWIMFHRRHADRIAHIWLQRIKESPPNKKLTLIYLSNEIVQQGKIRKKPEFVDAYSPIMVEATVAAYKGSPSDIQNKIRRVVEVWRQRLVFTPAIQDEIEKGIDALDRNRSSRKPALGGSLFSNSSVPPELSSVAPLATALQKAELNAKPQIGTANDTYDKITHPDYESTPQLHAAALASLVHKLATAEYAVSESIKARQSLISGLEKLLETNKSKLATEETQKSDLAARKVAVEGRRAEVERALLANLSASETQAISKAPLAVNLSDKARHEQGVTGDSERPQIEELTPPPMESFTPVGSPGPADLGINTDEFPVSSSHPVEPVSVAVTGNSALESAHVGADILHSLTRPMDDGTNGHQSHVGAYKKRKMSRSAAEDEYAAFAGDGDMEGIDDEVGNLI
ncbi:RNA polymerase II-binding domain-domain-containing protein [Clohesyomyces aquaticus]|uniref:RNA polymerase II-binding domain-domain-containing protein n=1 Tax=Clohesyomyces aquaticus TaxID=1231657 RepID=A0A1Y1YFT3_9PLEO|nr:RNA polymerase II-binding domain-domain-containing protein [Clohesyomyces aquaticus]